MDYQFRSETDTVYINADYRLSIISSSGIALSDGTTRLTARVQRISDGTEVQFDGSCFTWKRHENSEGFKTRTGNYIDIASTDLVSGSATFLCYFSKEGMYWKDTATITIEETVEGKPGADGKPGEDGKPGINAPYQRTAYKAAKEKPLKPTGNASAIPTGWSSVPPIRASNESIWATVAYVTYDDSGNAVYSEWSDPTEWSGKSTTPIVEWCWGTSQKYPPNLTNRVFLFDDMMVIADSSAFIDNDSGEWVRGDIPDQPEGKPYLWKREYNFDHTSSEDEWIYYPAQGRDGLPGDYMGLGYIIVGDSSVIFAGLDENGSPNKSSIRINIGNNPVIFSYAEFSITGGHDSYFLVCGISDASIQELDIAYINMNQNEKRAELISMTKDLVYTDGYILAEIKMSADTISNVNIIHPTRLLAYVGTYFMSILNYNDIDDINIAAEAMGIERVFTDIASFRIFTKALFANSIELTLDMDPPDGHEPIIGDIHSSNYQRGDYQERKTGFYLGADGHAELTKAILRDITIISKTANGDTIFEIQNAYNAGSFSHTETPTRKYFLDLVGNKTKGTLLVNGTECEYLFNRSNLLWSDYIYMFNTTKNDTLNTVAPYTGEVQFGVNAILTGKTTLNVYINNSSTAAVSLSANILGTPRKTITVNEGDVLRIEMSGSGTKMMLPVSYPNIAGGDVQGGTSTEFLIRQVVGDVKWTIAQYTTLYVDGSVTTNITKDGMDFDDMVWRLPSGESSTILTALADSDMAPDMIYVPDDGSYIDYKGRHGLASFSYNSDFLTANTTDGKTFIINNSNVSVSMNATISESPSGIRFAYAIPADSSYSSIGNLSTPFNMGSFKNIYIGDNHINGKSVFMLYSGKGNRIRTGTGDPIDVFYRVFSDKSIEYETEVSLSPYSTSDSGEIESTATLGLVIDDITLYVPETSETRAYITCRSQELFNVSYMVINTNSGGIISRMLWFYSDNKTTKKITVKVISTLSDSSYLELVNYLENKE